MNLREGKSGRQEGAAVCALAAAVLLLFCANGSAFYAAGNNSYGAVLLAALFSLLLLLFTAQTMEHFKQPELASFLEAGLGKWLVVPAALFIMLSLLALSALPIARFVNVLQENVFVRTGRELLGLYCLLPAAILAFCGFETLTRCGRLLLWLLPASLVIVLLLAAADYAPERLAPYAVLDWPRTVYAASAAVPLLLLPAAACLMTAQGQHGAAFAKQNGRLALLWAGGAAVAVLLVLGMRFPYGVLQSAPMPLYALTMQLKTGGSFGRPDLLLLFVWLLFAMLAAGYLLYAAALLFCRVFRMEDIRPAVAGGTGIALALLCRETLWSDSKTLLHYIGLFTAGILLLAAVRLRFCQRLRKERP